MPGLGDVITLVVLVVVVVGKPEPFLIELFSHWEEDCYLVVWGLWALESPQEVLQDQI